MKRNALGTLCAQGVKTVRYANITKNGIPLLTEFLRARVCVVYYRPGGARGVVDVLALLPRETARLDPRLETRPRRAAQQSQGTSSHTPTRAHPSASSLPKGPDTRCNANFWQIEETFENFFAS